MVRKIAWGGMQTNDNFPCDRSSSRQGAANEWAKGEEHQVYLATNLECDQ